MIHTFTGGTDGSVGSLGRLLLDASGNLYGVTEEGGAGSMVPSSNFRSAIGNWKFTTLYAFKGTPDAASPYSGLVADASGNLFGTTYYGGSTGAGAVFELARAASGHTANACCIASKAEATAAIQRARSSSARG